MYRPSWIIVVVHAYAHTLCGSHAQDLASCTMAKITSSTRLHSQQAPGLVRHVCHNYDTVFYLKGIPEHVGQNLEVANPGQYGLPYADLELKTQDELTLRCYLLMQARTLPQPDAAAMPAGTVGDEMTDEEVC